jgi:hypothetical protein
MKVIQVFTENLPAVVRAEGFAGHPIDLDGERNSKPCRLQTNIQATRTSEETDCRGPFSSGQDVNFQGESIRRAQPQTARRSSSIEHQAAFAQTLTWG